MGAQRGEETLDSQGITAQTGFGRVLERTSDLSAPRYSLENPPKVSHGQVAVKVKKSDLDLKQDFQHKDGTQGVNTLRI